MMKVLFVLILSLISFDTICQDDSLVIYNREDLVVFDPDTIYALSYSRMKLEQIPEDISTFQNLIYLDLSRNKLTKLPDEIADLVKLKVINLEKNKIDVFPIQFCRMSGLRSVIINRNLIESIPECIGGMKFLEYLDLYDNPIRSLPNSITELEKLKKIDLSGIRFSPSFQESWLARLPDVNIVFDAPCDCME